MIRLYLFALVGREECDGAPRTAGREECQGTPWTVGRVEYDGTPRTPPYVNVMSLLSADTIVPSPGAAYV